MADRGIAGPKIAKLGRYEVVSELGKGAMGIVYLARDPVIGRMVAIKTIRVNAGSDEEDTQEHARSPLVRFLEAPVAVPRAAIDGIQALRAAFGDCLDEDALPPAGQLDVEEVVAAYVDPLADQVVAANWYVPFLSRLAPTQSEPPFLVTQLIVVAIFAVLGGLATMRFRPTATTPA